MPKSHKLSKFKIIYFYKSNENFNYIDCRPDRPKMYYGISKNKMVNSIFILPKHVGKENRKCQFWRWSTSNRDLFQKTQVDQSFDSKHSFWPSNAIGT